MGGAFFVSWFGPMEEGGNPGTIGKAKQGPPVHPPGHPIDVFITGVLTTNSGATHIDPVVASAQQRH